ncbi:glycosyl transferase family group 2 protein [Nitzschia inconspicua]|uniref:Glycosyl transferase family group 2 protein n=1 Tax=Nitzschia inconspicua TaxID=303405 RepID=A0A9K3PNE7_9STRA|nr:glycosyl transferase family group 2 protein [Nitzschia inconspicua]
MSNDTLPTLMDDSSFSLDEESDSAEIGYCFKSEDDVEKAKPRSERSIDNRSMVERNFVPKMFKGSLPLQEESTGWLKYLPGLVVFQIGLILVSTETAFHLLLKNHGVSFVDSTVSLFVNDPVVSTVAIVLTLLTIASFVVNDVFTFVFLLHGKQRRSLPLNDRLVHAVIITQYKEPIEVLEATVDSLKDSTLHNTTIVVLACEDRDPHAKNVYEKLNAKYGHFFQDFIMTSHKLAPGEIAGCSSNENYAARHVWEYAKERRLDPFKLMLTICDADSLFDKVYLEHVEAEYWTTAGGQRAIYDAPINTYRNLNECNWLVQACEISRCQDGMFNGLQFRPAQSNYSLTLGFANEIGFWDPCNTSEDLHCTLKAMAVSGQGQNVIVRIWSLILNDSVASFKDRWTQAKRHMWGIEECAWTFQLYSTIRFVRWLGIFSFTVQRLLFSPNTVPSFIVLACPSIQEFLWQLSWETKFILGSYLLFMQSVTWIRVVLREFFLHRYILADRKHMKKAGWQCWCLLLTPLYLLVEQVSLTIFFTFATWTMLWRAFSGYTSIVYVVAPKALHEESNFSGKRKMIKKAA